MFWSSKRDIKLVCFDLDNTLYNFGDAEAQTEANIAKILERDIHKLALKDRHKNRRTGKSLLNNSLSASTILGMLNDIKKLHWHCDGTGIPEDFSRSLWFKELFDNIDLNTNLGISINSLMKNADAYEKIYWDYLDEKIVFFPNTIKTLKTLRDMGLKVAMFTDSDGKKQIKIDRIKKAGLEKYFDYILTSDDTGKNKPAAVNWEQLLKISNLKAKECIMVGDHPELDLITAKKLGFITIWTKEFFNTGIHWKYVDHEIHDIGEIVEIVKKING
jgi:HAD superfamily hydrolase (TIGR01509 family)